jgi:hypothetical protein
MAAFVMLDVGTGLIELGCYRSITVLLPAGAYMPFIVFISSVFTGFMNFI